jgi:hypothetical protein
MKDLTIYLRQAETTQATRKYIFQRSKEMNDRFVVDFATLTIDQRMILDRKYLEGSSRIRHEGLNTPTNYLPLISEGYYNSSITVH